MSEANKLDPWGTCFRVLKDVEYSISTMAVRLAYLHGQTEAVAELQWQMEALRNATVQLRYLRETEAKASLEEAKARVGNILSSLLEAGK